MAPAPSKFSKETFKVVLFGHACQTVFSEEGAFLERTALVLVAGCAFLLEGFTHFSTKVTALAKKEDKFQETKKVAGFILSCAFDKTRKFFDFLEDNVKIPKSHEIFCSLLFHLFADLVYLSCVFSSDTIPQSSLGTFIFAIVSSCVFGLGCGITHKAVAPFEKSTDTIGWRIPDLPAPPVLVSAAAAVIYAFSGRIPAWRHGSGITVPACLTFAAMVFLVAVSGNVMLCMLMIVVYFHWLNANMVIRNTAAINATATANAHRAALEAAFALGSSTQVRIQERETRRERADQRSHRRHVYRAHRAAVDTAYSRGVASERFVHDLIETDSRRELDNTAVDRQRLEALEHEMIASKRTLNTTTGALLAANIQNETLARQSRCYQARIAELENILHELQWKLLAAENKCHRYRKQTGYIVQLHEALVRQGERTDAFARESHALKAHLIELGRLLHRSRNENAQVARLGDQTLRDRIEELEQRLREDEARSDQGADWDVDHLEFEDENPSAFEDVDEYGLGSMEEEDAAAFENEIESIYDEDYEFDFEEVDSVS